MRPKVRQYDKEEQFPAEDCARWDDGLLRHAGAGRVGRRGDGFDNAVHAGRSGARGRGYGGDVERDEQRRCVPIWKHGTEEQKKKYLRRCGGGNSGRVLFDGAGGGVRCGWDSGARGAARRRLQIKRHEELGVDRRRFGSVHGVCENGPGGGIARRDGVFSGADFPGFRISRYEDKMGLRSSRSAEIVFDECGVPVANRLGEEGQGLKVALEGLDGGRMGIASQAVGIAQGAIEASVKYAKQRKAFGQKIGEFQGIQWMIADMQMEIEAARGLMIMRPGCGIAERAGGERRREGEIVCERDGESRVYKAVQVHGSAGIRGRGMWRGLSRRACFDDL